MRITEIEKQNNNTDRYNIYIDNLYSFSIDIDLLYEFKLKKDKEVDKENLDVLIKKVQFKKGLNTCIRTLAKSNKTQYEICEKLKKFDYDIETIDEILIRLKKLGYIDDDKYVENFIRVKKANSKYSKKMICFKLMQKGIDKNLINEKISEATIDDYLCGYNLALKKYKKLNGIKIEKRRKLLNHLYMKGFDSDTCTKILREIEKNTDEQE